jgi:hypothetical protein
MAKKLVAIKKAVPTKVVAPVKKTASKKKAEPIKVTASVKKVTPIKKVQPTATSGKSKRAINPALAEHKIAVKHLETATKYHYDAMNHLESGNHQKAKESTEKAHGIMGLLEKMKEKISNFYNS